MKVLTSSVMPFNPRYRPILPLGQRGIVNNLSSAHTESVNHIALPGALNTVSPSAAPQALMQYSPDFQGASSTSFPPYPAIVAPIGGSDADVQPPTAVDSATQVAALHFSPEAAEVVVGHLSAYISENLIQHFLDALQPAAEDADAQKRITEFALIGAAFTLPEVLNRVGVTRTAPLLTPAGLKHLVKLMLKIVDASDFLSVKNPYLSHFGRPHRVIADQHKMVIVMLGLLHFVFKESPAPFYFSLMTLARRSGLNPGISTLKRLYFDYKRNKPKLEQVLHQHQDELDLKGVKRWANFMLDHNHQRGKTNELLKGYDDEFEALPPAGSWGI